MVNVRQLHRLNTHEDSRYAHAHKIFGFLALFHMIWRMYLMHTTGNMGFAYLKDTGKGWVDLACIGVHAALHITSFQFILSNRRNKVYNIIWPEMRWHTMIFSYRSIVTWLVMWLGVDSWPMRVAIVFMTMICADVATLYYKNSGKVEMGDSTMRSNPYPYWVPRWAIKVHNYFYSASQVLATLNILSARNIEQVFSLLIAIHTAPFGMTLVKKGIIRQTGWHVFYTGALIYNYWLGWQQLAIGSSYLVPHFYWIAFTYFCVARFCLHINKYALWIAICTGWFMSREKWHVHGFTTTTQS